MLCWIGVGVIDIDGLFVLRTVCVVISVDCLDGECDRCVSGVELS